jgi:hypothetical protein
MIPQVAALAFVASPLACGGPYSAAMADAGNPYDAPVPGFVGPHGAGKARIVTGIDEDWNEIVLHPYNHVNPLFFAWAAEVVDYAASEFVQTGFSDPSLALGPVTGDNWHVVSLGDMTATQIANGNPPGTITLRLARPVRDLTGADFVVFENGIIAGTSESGAAVGQIFGELAYVEVSADGENFVRFPATSLTSGAVGGYGSIDATQIRNLAGKHSNAGGESWGTPFDLADVGLSEIQYVRVVDIPGSGAFADSGGRPIYDPWKTFGSGGFDLEAVGAISSPMSYGEWPLLEELPADKRGMEDDPDGDGIPNLLEYAFARLPWLHDADEGLPRLRIESEGGVLSALLEFVRDERLVDVTYEVQVSPSLAAGDWTTVARSTGGGPVTAMAGHTPVISETDASPLASIGVLRKVSVRDDAAVTAQQGRFYRVKVTSESVAEPQP